MEALKQKLREFAKARDWDQFHSPKNLAMALSVEVAELVEHFQWLTQEESYITEPEKLEAIRQEIGDILIYLTRLSDKLGIDPLQASRDKIEINGRKYPVEAVRGSARKYNEGLKKGQTIT
ncbi:MAG: nucleotide pyrophosphohydrolase [Desulfobacterium sp.]|nr:nucleotide pyrophosphohydrolase [Desulfobacterium sp.]